MYTFFPNEMAQAENSTLFKASINWWVLGYRVWLWLPVGASHHHTSSQILVLIATTSRSYRRAQERIFPKLFLKLGSRRKLVRPPEFNKLAEGALIVTVYVIDENVKQHRSQYGPLRDATCHRRPFGHWAVDHYPLPVNIQSIPYPVNSSPVKSISPQFREKHVVGDSVKGLTEVQIDDIHCFSLVHWCNHSIIEGH